MSDTQRPELKPTELPSHTALDGREPTLAPYTRTQIANVMAWTKRLESNPQELSKGFLTDVLHIASMLMRGELPPAAVNIPCPQPWNKRTTPATDADADEIRKRHERADAALRPIHGNVAENNRGWGDEHGHRAHTDRAALLRKLSAAEAEAKALRESAPDLSVLVARLQTIRDLEPPMSIMALNELIGEIEHAQSILHDRTHSTQETK